MYTVMLLDDEPLLLKGLAEDIDWARSGFQVITTARHGLEGIERYIDCQPDLILTDIRMRFMDGLDFLREIRRLNDQAEVVILSAYNSFEYAQTACALGASDYLLKPIQPDQLAEALAKVRARLDTRYSLSKRLAAVKWLDDERRESLRTTARRRLLLMDAGREELDFVLPELGGGSIELRVLLTQNGDAERAGLLSSPLADMLADAFAGETWFSAVLDSGVICTVLHAERDEDEARRIIQATLDRAARLMGVTATGVLSDPVNDPAQLHAAYCTAEERLRVAVMMGVSGLADERGLPSIPLDYGARAQLQVRLMALFPDGTREQAVEWAALLNERTASGGLFFPAEARILFLEFLARLTELSGVPPCDYGLWVDRLEPVMRRSEAEAPAALGGLIADLIEQCRSDRGSPIGRYLSDLVGETVLYVREHLPEPGLNLTTASAALHVSAGYLGRVFKRATGRSFATHLTDARLERAMALITQPGARINDVCFEVGYQNVSYFIVLFKKKFGLTPGEYRTRTEGEVVP